MEEDQKIIEQKEKQKNEYEYKQYLALKAKFEPEAK